MSMNPVDPVSLKEQELAEKSGAIREDVLARVTGGGGIVNVLEKGYYQTGDTFLSAPTGGIKPRAIKPFGPDAVAESDKLLTYWGNARPSGVGISGVTLEKKPASSGTLTPSEGSAFHKP